MMPRDYAQVSPTFWTGETGRALREAGADAQRIAFYLLTCPNSNMLGLYYLPLPTLCHEVGITPQGASKALQRVSEAGFAHYDAPSDMVYVPEMARYQIGERLKAGDKRVAGILKSLGTVRKSVFCKDFCDKYRQAYHIPDDFPPEAPSKPLRSQEQEQEQEQDKPPIVPHADNGQKTKRFVPPTVEEVDAYCLERNNGIDGQAFLDHYETNGWRYGKGAGKPVKDWKACVRTWENQRKADEPRRLIPLTELEARGKP